MKVILYALTKEMFDFLEHSEKLNCKVVAIADSSKRDVKINDIPVISPADIKKFDYDKIIICHPRAEEQLYIKLIMLGVNSSKIDFAKRFLISNFNFQRKIIDPCKLTNKNFSIVSDDCWGGFIYRALNLPINTPFAWVYIKHQQYLKLLGNLEFYLNKDIEVYSSTENANHPVGFLDDIEIYFFHYKEVKHAKDTWNRRLDKFNKDNYFVKAALHNEEYSTERPITSENMDLWLEKFNNLKIKNKVAFTSSTTHFDSCVNIDDSWKILRTITEDQRFYQFIMGYSDFYLDIVNWLNTGEI